MAEQLKRVAVFEDDPRVRDLLKMVVKCAGANVVAEAETREQALGWISNWSQSSNRNGSSLVPDIIITDANFTGSDAGGEDVREISRSLSSTALGSQVKLIGVSGRPWPTDVPVVKSFLKPVDIREVIDSIRDL